MCYILAVTWGILALPDMYALGPASLWQSGIHIRESPYSHVTTITYTPMVSHCVHLHYIRKCLKGIPISTGHLEVLISYYVKVCIFLIPPKARIEKVVHKMHSPAQSFTRALQIGPVQNLVGNSRIHNFKQLVF